LFSNIVFITIFVSLVSLFFFWQIGVKNNNFKLAGTFVFAILGTIDLIYAISFKNLRRTIFKMENLFSNKFLFLAVFYGFLLLFLAIYFPAFQKILNTVPLQFWHWGVIFGIGILTTIILEFIKVFSQKFIKNEKNEKI